MHSRIIIFKSEFYDWLIASFYSILSLGIYYIYYHIDVDSIGISILASLFRSLVLCIVLSCVRNACEDNVYTGGAFMLLALALYNQISNIKYTVPYLYTGSINNMYTRIVGSLYVDLLIIFVAIVFLLLHKKMFRGKHNGAKEYRLNGGVVYASTILFSVVQLYTVSKYGVTVSARVSRTMLTFVMAFIYVIYAMAILYVKAKDNGKIIWRSCIPIAVLFITNLYITMVSGKKNYVIVFGMVIICGLLVCKRIKFKIVKRIAYAMPVIMTMLVIISEALGKREGFYTEFYRLQYHAFRFDLSDLATTISIRHSNINSPLKIIGEAAKYSIPSVFSPNKVTDLLEYKRQLISVGLNSEFDFNDTFFSMGAQVGGFTGMIIVLLLILLLFEIISNIVISISKMGDEVFLVLLSYFATCESDWSMFVFNTRDIIIYIIVAFTVMNIIGILRHRTNESRTSLDG